MNWLLPLIATLVALALLHPGLQGRAAWRAMVTPLASIIGSGFLVVAPLLAAVAGAAAVWGMLLIVAVAYLIGVVLRFNIRHAEPLLEQGEKPLLTRTERTANLALSAAYVISIAFYVRLLAAFVLRGFGIDGEVPANALATAVLAFIGLTGWRHGLHSLERLESYSVSVKLAIIVALLTGLAWFDMSHAAQLPAVTAGEFSLAERLQILAGMLLVVQGFETSRYLGAEYSPGLRVRSMRQAQWLSALIYVVFVALITPLLGDLGAHHPDETAIIGLAAQAAAVLSPMLVVAAVMSQFSAAVADTVGAGGLLQEETHRRLTDRRAYPLIVACAIALIWFANVFELVALASRAFALYYLAQTLVALQAVPRHSSRRTWYHSMFGALAVLLLAVVLFARPVA